MSISSVGSRFVNTVIPKTGLEAGMAGAVVLTALFYSSAVGAAIGSCYIGYKGIARFLARSIYQPEIPKGPFSSEELEKIKQVENVVKVVKVKNIKTDFWETAYITSEKGRWGHEKFFLFNLGRDQLGWAEAVALPLTDPKFESSWTGGPPSQYIGYGNNPNRSDKVLLEALHTKDDDIQEQYKYSGYQLFKMVEETYREKFKGQIILEAGYNSHAFYYKLGFRSADSSVNAKIEQAISQANGAEPKTSRLGTVLMHLPAPRISF